jgi:hypothetical protein
MPSDAVWAAVLTLVGVVFGYLAKPVSEIVLHKQTETSQRREAGRSFQRDTLLELQPLLSQLVDRAIDSHIQDDAELERFEAVKRIDAKVAMLAVRVADDELRSRTRILRGAAERFVDILSGPGDDEYDQARAMLADALDDANERLGEVLRSTYPND